MKRKNFIFAMKDKYFKNFTNPPIPKSYHYVKGLWYNGFVIERDFDGSQFVWVPVGWLLRNGTLDSSGKGTISFSEKFGRRITYYTSEPNLNFFKEELTEEFKLQIKSVKKYGGFYISRFLISGEVLSNSQEELIQSIKGAWPLRDLNFYTCYMYAQNMEKGPYVKSHLPFGAEYDSILEWFVKSKALTLNEITVDSTNLGNFSNTECSIQRVVKNGSFEESCINNIYDFGGNISEWTQEQYGNLYRVIRGGSCIDSGNIKHIAYHTPESPLASHFTTGFRASLYIK